ncbi:MAG: DUF2269 family protein [Pseudomonadota bacterium]
MTLRQILKITHTIAAAGLIGGLGCYLVIHFTASVDAPAAFAEQRQIIVTINKFVLLPSLALAIGSGILAMVVHQAFLDRGWVWIKAISGVLMFEGILVVSAKARDTASLAERIANGEIPASELYASTSNETGLVSVVLGVSIANVVLGVWRPRLFKD